MRKDDLRRTARSIARTAVRAVAARAPFLPTESTSGGAAIAGGKPVRDLRLRPWPPSPSTSLVDWVRDVEPALREVFLSGVEGLPQPRARDFASRFAAWCGARHGLLVPHGTDALRVGLAAALEHDGLEWGGEVIVPNLTFIASANAVLDRHLRCVFVDVDPDTLTIDPRQVEEAIRPGVTRAILPVHLFGLPCDMGALRAIAAKHGLKLVEDAAQAHGAVHEIGPVGSLGDVAAFSFQSSKNLSSGEGGALTTNDNALFERAYQLHNVGRPSVGAHRWLHASFGLNTRVNEYTAALLSARFARHQVEQDVRWDRFRQLHVGLGDVACVTPLALPPWVRRHGAHMFVFRYHPDRCGGLSTEDFARALQAEGVPATAAYPSTVSAQAPLQALAARFPDRVRSQETPVAEGVIGKLLYLPHPLLLGGASDIDEVVAAFAKVQRHFDGQRPSSAARTSTVPPSATTTAPPVATRERRVPRIGVIGVGLQGQLHLRLLRQRRDVRVVGVVDADASRATLVASEAGCRSYADVDTILDDVDAIVIATPHRQHAAAAVGALRRGTHVLLEKPLASSVIEADAIIGAAGAGRGVFSMVFQSRFDPPLKHLRALVEQGELGRVYSCHITEAGLRTRAYYRESPWRGTWRGEGGGVIVNQAPHVLDRYLWLVGRPSNVVARAERRLRDVETEDSCSLLLGHDRGVDGYIHVDTHTAPAVSSHLLLCDGGRAELLDGRLRVTRLRASIDATRLSSREAFAQLDGRTFEVPVAPLGPEELLTAQHDNFLAAVAGDAALVAPGVEGLASVELANAALLSAEYGATVRLPLDRRAWGAFFAEKTGEPVAD